MEAGRVNRRARAGVRSVVLPRVRSLPLARRYPGLAIVTTGRSRRLRDDVASVRSFLLFVGHPRSGHSLVGALVDAPHERHRGPRARCAQVRRSSLRPRPALHADHPAPAGPGDRQPAIRQRLRLPRPRSVAGSLRAARGHRREGGPLHRPARFAARPVRPSDPDRRPTGQGGPGRARSLRQHRHHVPAGPPSLSEHADSYFELARTVRSLRQRVDDDQFHELRLENPIAEPTTTLSQSTAFLGLTSPPDYLAACRSVVFPTARRTRTDAAWTAELLDLVARRASEHPSLDGYRFADGGREALPGGV